ncbi:alkaline phosphatase family protein [uncultured Paraglaciecola sp.]|uniref:alkaline phosphatase family protein n=1 Tax=uncultured Paraglaciecola sp. TaxID=1765024 RepID=UPI0026395917|nr:alkaline phosphatase family protein [uncultured Paraglaciecola sp.]
MKAMLIMCLCCFAVTSKAADNLLLVSIDGLRWQEVFQGYQNDVLNLEAFKDQKTGLEQQFHGSNAALKRQKLMPFLWDELAKNGVLIGNRDLGSKMQVSNDYWFSYPGYNELLTGKADPKIDSNKALNNANVTILEWLNKHANYQGKVAAFGSWDVFPAIINRTRSGIPINAGFESADWSKLSNKANWLNALQKQVPSPWDNVRLDAFTVGFAEEYIMAHKPKVIYIALGETDDFAHQGNYPEYLRGANRADQFIAQLWALLQSIEQYQDNTNLVITVDHGRGNSASSWQHHASPKAIKGYLKGLNQYKDGIPGAEQIWLAAMGPDVKNTGEMKNSQNFALDQVAATAISLLNLEHKDFATDIAPPLPILKKAQ